MTLYEKFKYFHIAHWRGTVIVLTPILLLAMLAPYPPEKYQWCGYTILVMGIYWMTECIPIVVTSFLPIVIFPLVGVASTGTVCKAYINDAIMLFIGSLFLAYALAQSGIHKRIAYCTIGFFGYSHYKLLLAMCTTTTFLSMWITNTAATTLMVPINFALLKAFEDRKALKIYETNAAGEKVASDIATCYFCASTFSATIGGIGTLIGTATNLVFKGLYVSVNPLAPDYLSFINFSAFTIPIMILLEVATYFYFIVVYFGFLRPKSDAAKSATITDEVEDAVSASIDRDREALGDISFWEVMVIVLFSGAMIALFFRSPPFFPGWGDEIIKHFGIEDSTFILDSALAMFAAFLMFLLPSTLDFFKNCKAKYHEDFPKKPVVSVLNWEILNAKMPISYIFLLGAGFALSNAFRSTGLNKKLGETLAELQILPNEFVILIVIVVVMILTNFASNVAVINVFGPITMQLAKEINQSPLVYILASGLTASFAFMIPTGTPGNLVAQSAANIPTAKMIKAGVGPSISAIILTFVFVLFWAPIVWPDLNTVPT